MVKGALAGILLPSVQERNLLTSAHVRFDYAPFDSAPFGSAPFGSAQGAEANSVFAYYHNSMTEPSGLI